MSGLSSLFYKNIKKLIKKFRKEETIMLINILFAIIVLFVTVINFVFFFTTSGKQMVQEIEDQSIVGKIGLIIIYLPALLARFIINLFKISYKKHKPIYESIGEFITIFLTFISIFVIYILLYALGFK